MIFKANPETKASIVVVVLVTAAFLLGDWLGLVADQQTMVLAQQKNLSEQLALQVSNDVRTGNLSRIETSVKSFVQNFSEVESVVFVSPVVNVEFPVGDVGVRTPSNEVLGNSVLIVPVYDGSTRFGSVEVYFSAMSGGGRAAVSNFSVAALIFFCAAAGFLFHRLFMGRPRGDLEFGPVVPERIKQAFDSLAEGVLILDETGRIAHSNRAFKQSCSLQSYMLAGTWLHDLNWKAYLSDEPVDEKDLPWVRVLKAGESILGVKLTLKTHDAVERAYAVNCTPLQESDEGYRGVIVTLDNLSDLEQRNARLKKSLTDLKQTKLDVDVKNRELQLLAARDPLTNCLNRRAFTEQYNVLHIDAEKSGDPLVCVMVDIDHFKRINDNYGHALGDRVIKFVAKVLGQQIRHDDLVGRYGGEEFCIILENTSLPQAVAATERMRKEIAAGDPELFGSALRTTASFGVACMQGEVVSSDELIHRADKTLYLAKESGRNRVMVWEKYSPGVDAATLLPDAIESEQVPTGSVARLGSLGELSDTEREWQLEDAAVEYAKQLGEYQLPELRAGFSDKGIFADRVQRALLLAKRETREMAVLSLGLEIKRQDEQPLDTDYIDQSLREVIVRLEEALRDSDAVSVFPDSHSLSSAPIVTDADMGIVLPAIIDAECVAWIAQRLSETLAQPMCVNDQNMCVSSHIGVAVYPDDGEDAQSIIRGACLARYYSQSRNESNGIEYKSAQFNTVFRDRLQIEHDMHAAVDNGEFELLYQPKIQMQSGEISGFEALLRWNHPRRGVLTPNEFLDIAERTRMINPIGDWVLRESCRQVVELSEACSRDLSCAVNLSLVQLSQPDLVDQILQVTQDEGLNPKNLELELTEDCLQGGLDKRYQKLTELQKLGVSIAIDDFGAGCSGLNHLRNLPVDIVKIDRCFVADIVENEHDVAIVSAILSMARALELRVIAEGVESKAQFDVLGALACDEAQGYFFGRPVPASEARELLLGAQKVAHTG